MRDFLKKILLRLPFIAGINQLKDYSQRDLVSLLDELEAECKSHSYLDIKTKQELIENGIKNYPEFYGLNRKIICKWFLSYKESNQVTGKQPDVHPDYFKIVAKNDEEFKKELADKRKEDPSYDPKKEAMNQILNITKAKSQDTGRKRRGGGEYVQYENVD